MGNWNYSTGNATEKKIVHEKYAKQNITLKSRGKRSGITFELRDAFKDLEKKGKLIDTKHNGFTKEDAQNLYKELDKIHKERKLNRDYLHMNKGTAFEYSEKEIQRLANAAGYKTPVKINIKNTCLPDHTGVKKQTSNKPLKIKA